MLLPEPALRVEAPSTLQASLNVQPAQNRQIVHLLHYIPERRGREFDIIEDVVPIFGVPVSVRVGGPVSGVKLAPQGVPVQVHVADGRVEFLIPRIDGHQMVEIVL